MPSTSASPDIVLNTRLPGGRALRFLFRTLAVCLFLLAASPYFCAVARAAEGPNQAPAAVMVGGDRDTVVPRASEADVEKGVPNVRRVELTPCGHYPQYTMPVPYAEEVANFFGTGNGVTG